MMPKKVDVIEAKAVAVVNVGLIAVEVAAQGQTDMEVRLINMVQRVTGVDAEVVVRIALIMLPKVPTIVVVMVKRTGKVL